MCLHGEMVRVQVFASFIHIWCKRGYSTTMVQLTRVHRKHLSLAFQIESKAVVMTNGMIAPPPTTP